MEWSRDASVDSIENICFLPFCSGCILKVRGIKSLPLFVEWFEFDFRKSSKTYKVIFKVRAQPRFLWFFFNFTHCHCGGCSNVIEFDFFIYIKSKTLLLNTNLQQVNIYINFFLLFITIVHHLQVAYARWNVKSVVCYKKNCKGHAYVS